MGESHRLKERKSRGRQLISSREASGRRGRYRKAGVGGLAGSGAEVTCHALDSAYWGLLLTPPTALDPHTSGASLRKGEPRWPMEQACRIKHETLSSSEFQVNNK